MKKKTERICTYQPIYPHETRGHEPTWEERMMVYFGVKPKPRKRLRREVVFIGSLLFMLALIWMDYYKELPQIIYLVPFLIGAYQSIAAGETDADSPITETLMDKFRTNGDGFNDGTAIANNAIDENHLNSSVAGSALSGGGGSSLDVGVDNSSIEITGGASLNVKASGIKQGELKVASDESITGNGTAVMPSGGWSHIPQFKCGNVMDTFTGSYSSAYTIGTSFVPVVYMNGSGANVYCKFTIHDS